MSIPKSKLITGSALAALGGVAALALATQPGPSAAGQSDAASITEAKPKIKRQVVHRTKHVQAKPVVAAAASVPAVPVAAPAPVPVASSSDDDAGEDDSAPAPSVAAGDDSAEIDSESEDSDRDEADEVEQEEDD